MVTTSPAFTGRLAARDALAVEPHMAGIHQRSRRCARAHDARVPQPFVDALAVVASVHRDHARSLFASSCSFSAASLANGEFGSACAAPLLRIAPLARLVAIAILEVAPAAFAARATILPVAIRTLAAAPLALRRTALALTVARVRHDRCADLVP